MSTVDRRVRELIGDMTINLLAAQGEVEKAVGQRNSAYEMLDACILTGQVPESDVPALLAKNADFAAWRSRQNPA